MDCCGCAGDWVLSQMSDYDEDLRDYDDRLGNVHVRANCISEFWNGIREQLYKIKKRMGSKRTYLFRGCAAMFSNEIQMSGGCDHQC